MSGSDKAFTTAADLVQAKLTLAATEARVETMQQQVNELRRQDVANVLKFLSSDVLALVFDDEVVQLDTPWECGLMEYDDTAARAPFRLAAVCRHWRDVSFATATIWGLSCRAELLDRVQLLAERSRQAPIVIVITASTLTLPNPYEKIFNILAHLLLVGDMSTGRDRPIGSSQYALSRVRLLALLRCSHLPDKMEHRLPQNSKDSCPCASSADVTVPNGANLSAPAGTAYYNSRHVNLPTIHFPAVTKLGLNDYDWARIIEAPTLRHLEMYTCYREPSSLLPFAHAHT
ncbi:hypothetical protein BKA62DRAFT_762416 [Auriculariales sp. MPI-PUGE-AT-0066]|nr:hypothetical protein BKA62DRAFT_762416 [Auriculariales sp. MPI-PUGE-AT-0066]